MKLTYLCVLPLALGLYFGLNALPFKDPQVANAGQPAGPDFKSMVFGAMFGRNAGPGQPGPEASATGAQETPQKAEALDQSVVRSLIRTAAEKHQVPEAFVKSIVAVESNFDSTVVSSKGAIGLMQLMPATARAYGADPSVPEQNVDAGTRYLRCLMQRYHQSPLSHVIAAYNAGPSAVDRYHGVPPFRETRGYVKRVMAFLRLYRKGSAQSRS